MRDCMQAFGKWIIGGIEGWQNLGSVMFQFYDWLFQTNVNTSNTFDLGINFLFRRKIFNYIMDSDINQVIYKL